MCTTNKRNFLVSVIYYFSQGNNIQRLQIALKKTLSAGFKRASQKSKLFN
jgi:hypothetical protein